MNFFEVFAHQVEAIAAWLAPYVVANLEAKGVIPASAAPVVDAVVAEDVPTPGEATPTSPVVG